MSKENFNLNKIVSKDFNATLQSFVRTLSMEEIDIINEYQKSKTVDNLTLSSSNEFGESIYRSNKFPKYELIVDSLKTLTSGSDSGNQITIQEKVFTRPVKTMEFFTPKPRKKSIKYLERFLPTFESSNIPFESTTIDSLPYYIVVKLNGKSRFLVRVTELYTVDMIKSKICKHFNIKPEQQTLFFKGKVLQGSSLLCSYGIRSDDEIILKKSDKFVIYGLFEEENICLEVYSSTTVLKVKKSFLKKIENEKISDIEIMYKDTLLLDHNELFVYNIKDKSEVTIVQIKRKTSSRSGCDVSDEFFKITDDLLKCKCAQLRIDAMTILMAALCNIKVSDLEFNRSVKIMKEIDASRCYHHINCFKLLSTTNNATQSVSSSISELESTSYSGSDSSLKSAICAENERLDQTLSLQIDDSYIKLLSECDGFKKFKSLLKNKIGNKYTLQSVALLYKYARSTVRYIGINYRETNPDVERIIRFTKLYFERYFKKDIVKMGGLDALTLSGSEVD